MSCIYLWHNTKTDTIYIGQTSKTFEHRKRQHINNLRADRHANRHLQRAFNKYGETAFEVDTLEEIDNPAILEDAEYFWINYFRSIGAELYNIAPVGISRRGVKHTDESKAKIGVRTKQDWQNPEYRASMAHYRSDDHMRQMTELAAIAKKEKAKEFLFISPSGEIITVKNVSQYSAENNLHPSAMYQVANGKKASYKGYRSVKVQHDS